MSLAREIAQARAQVGRVLMHAPPNDYVWHRLFQAKLELTRALIHIRLEASDKQRAEEETEYL